MTEMKRKRGRPKKVVVNIHREEISDAWWERDEKTVWPLWLDDIVSGVARLDWYGNKENQIPLSTVNMIKCLSILDEITVDSVMELLELKKSQAKLYVTACALCLPYIGRSLRDTPTKRLKYPYGSICSYEQGLSLGYDRQDKYKI